MTTRIPTPSPWYRGDAPTHHLTTAGTLSCGAATGADVMVSTATNAVDCAGCVRVLNPGTRRQTLVTVACGLTVLAMFLTWAWLIGHGGGH